MYRTESPNDSTAVPERLFLGIALTEEIREALREWLGSEEIPGRRVPVENWHLTLRFLGDTPPAAKARLIRSMRGEALGRRFVVPFGGVGAFPRPARASVLWLGVADDADKVAVLAQQVNTAVERAGFPVDEDRPFTPHLTLSRIRPPADVRRLVGRRPAFEPRMPVESVVLFRSRLGAGPAQYEALELFELDRDV